ncbi:hypothetical protein FNV43_RR23737 [Rhamnella rubrinervis]|uniref:Origin of replication complex subunit 3 n=1 Tax=Rhamnella rubrinervis TaxID=2594499 RepID=A0A8K0DKF6_9ROSA|nr:hypothetical protein FNV43_RR23737 [Rhamnella rubrinervis]
MAASSATTTRAVSPSQSTAPEYSDNNLQPFFLLHKASSRISLRKCTPSPSKPFTTAKLDTHRPHPHSADLLRMEAFLFVWSRIHSAIKDVLRVINISAFNDIYSWVLQSFHVITSSAMPAFAHATRSFPLLTHATSKQLFTGLVLTKSMEYVDDLLTFEELGLCLKSHGCHVANLSSSDLSTKNGIGGCLKSLLRQFLMVSLEAADMSILASWYREQGNYNSPVVVIIDDMEQCCRSVLSDFILMLSEWAVKIPMILIMGVATTLDAPRNILPSNVLQQLCTCKFMLGSPAEKMDAVLEASLMRQCSGFSIGHKVAVFLRNYFLNQDGTLTSFIRALKVACAQHFSMEPLSFIAGVLVEEDSEKFQGDRSVLSEAMFEHASELLSHASNQMAEQIGNNWTCHLRELKRLQKYWSTVVLCLHEAGKHNKIRLLDIFCEALDPDVCNSMVSHNRNGSRKGIGIFTPPSDHFVGQQHFTMWKGGFICQAIQKVRVLPEALLSQLLKSWENLTRDILEIHDKVKELQSMMKFEDERVLKEDLTDISMRHTSRSRLTIESSKKINEKAASLLDCMVREFLRPIDCIPFHEIVCFKNVEKLQLALIGDPRRRVQVDLLEFQKILQCNCCSRTGNIPIPSMPDTSIMYTLAQEHGDLINLPDWFQSFKTIISHPASTRGKRKLKQSPLPKKTKDTGESENKSEASIQAVTELQITGLIRMPSKRRPDFVQRVAFGYAACRHNFVSWMCDSAAKEMMSWSSTDHGKVHPLDKPFKIFVGYDTREHIAYEVCRHSILKRLSIPVKIIPIKQSEMRKSGLCWSERGLESTDFVTRFLTPCLANYQRWAMFVDCEFLYPADIKELRELIDDKYAVSVQHDFTPKGDHQNGWGCAVYPRKNWSYMVLYNCGHPENSLLTPQLVNTQTGAFLYRFQWLEDHQIGFIPFP